MQSIWLQSYYYVTYHANLFFFPIGFIIIRFIALRTTRSLKKVELAWLILSSLFIGIMWRAAAMDGFGLGLSVGDLVGMLIASLYYSFMIALFIIPDLLELRKIPDHKERRKVFNQAVRSALAYLLGFATVNFVINTLLGLYRYYTDEFSDWAGNLGFLGVLMLVLPLILLLGTMISSPFFCFLMLHRSFNAVVKRVYAALNQVLMNLFQQQYGLSPSMVHVMQSGYTFYNLDEVAENPQWIFEYENNYARLAHLNAPIQMVENEARPTRILQNLADLMEQSNGEKVPPQRAEPILTAIVESGEFVLFPGALSTAWRAYSWMWPDQRHPNLSSFFRIRSKEIESIVVAQLKIYANDYRGIRAGLDGEEAVQRVLDAMGGAIIPLYNLRLEFPGKDGSPNSVEVDALVLAPNGIFALEVKNFGAYKSRYEIIVSQDGNWYKEFTYQTKRGTQTKREKMDNPFLQNARHTSYLERFVNQILGRSMSNWIPVQGIVVLANDNVMVRVEPGAPQAPTRIATLYDRLRQNMKPVLSEDELRQLASAFKARNLPPHKYELYDYRGEIQQFSKDCKTLLDMAQDVSRKIDAGIKEHPELERYLCGLDIYDFKLGPVVHRAFDFLIENWDNKR